VGALRSIFDSEWTLLGNGVPFWTLLGLAAAGIPAAAAEPSRDAVTAGKALALRLSAGLGLVFALLLLQASQTRDAVQAQFQQTRQPVVQAKYLASGPGHCPVRRKFRRGGAHRAERKALVSACRIAQPGGQTRRGDSDVPQSRRSGPERDAVLAQAGGHAAGTKQAEEAKDAWAHIAALDEGQVGTVRAIQNCARSIPPSPTPLSLPMPPGKATKPKRRQILRKPPL
jgi:hypothetical protein